MALVTVFDQHRSDPLLEELEAGRGIGGGGLAENPSSGPGKQGETQQWFHAGDRFQR